MGVAVSMYQNDIPVMLKWAPENDHLKKVCYVYAKAINFLWLNLNWLKETSGAKTLLVRIPDAIVQISKRIGPAESVPGKVINRVADFITPLNVLGGPAKSLLAFADLGSKFTAIFADHKTNIDYVVKDENGAYYKAQLPLYSWGGWANRAQAFAEWSMALSECGSYLWKYQNPTSEGSFPLSTFSTWTGRCLNIKNLCSDSWFLYQTWGTGNHQRFVSGRYENVTGQNLTIANEEVAGAVMKITFTVMCISLDLFKTFAAKQYVPFWLEPAIFWTNIATTFAPPVVFNYWPSLVTKPLYAAAG